MFKIDPSQAIPVEEVESAAEIVKRFATGAMSLASISTAPLIVYGCIMMRKCHLNTCPVGSVYGEAVE